MVLYYSASTRRRRTVNNKLTDISKDSPTAPSHPPCYTDGLTACNHWLCITAVMCLKEPINLSCPWSEYLPIRLVRRQLTKWPLQTNISFPNPDLVVIYTEHCIGLIAVSIIYYSRRWKGKWVKDKIYQKAFTKVFNRDFYVQLYAGIFLGMWNWVV